MEFNSQICTSRSQSERLLALGLKIETADMAYEYKPKHLADTDIDKDWVIVAHSPCGTDIPAWSLHRLLCLLPDKTPYSDGYLTVEVINENVYIVLVIDNVEQRVLKYTKGNLYDNLISCINFFVRESLFNKEYLE